MSTYLYDYANILVCINRILENKKYSSSDMLSLPNSKALMGGKASVESSRAKERHFISFLGLLYWDHIYQSRHGKACYGCQSFYSRGCGFSFLISW